MAFPCNADRDAGTQAVISKHRQQGRIAWQSAINNNLLHSAKQFQASNTCFSRSVYFFNLCSTVTYPCVLLLVQYMISLKNSK